MENREITLNSGYCMPKVGLGTWQTDDEESVRAAIFAAIDAGYRHIDTAFVYKNEKLLGTVLQEVFNSGKVKREDLFIVTKLPVNGMQAEVVNEFFMKSLTDLKLNCIDLYLIHTAVSVKRLENDYEPYQNIDGDIPIDTSVDLVETWKVLETLVDRGLVKSIGVSNFNSQQIQRIYDASRIKPANVQIECHAYLPQFELVEFCKKLNISVTAYSPLGSPGLANFAKTIFDERGFEASEINLPSLLKDETLTPLVKKYNKTAAQILLRYLLQRDIIVIPKSSNSKRIQENIAIFDFALEEEDIELLKTMSSRKFRYFDFAFSKNIVNHPEYPFKIPF